MQNQTPPAVDHFRNPNITLSMIWCQNNPDANAIPTVKSAAYLFGLHDGIPLYIYLGIK
ncbi:MAG: hypothetical protein WAU01_09395 [Saprospiraceae bacterium]